MRGGKSTALWEEACPQAGVCLLQHRASILPELLPLFGSCLIPVSTLGIGYLVSSAGMLPGCLSMRSDGFVTLQACTLTSRGRNAVPRECSLGSALVAQVGRADKSRHAMGMVLQ